MYRPSSLSVDVPLGHNHAMLAGVADFKERGSAANFDEVLPTSGRRDDCMRLAVAS